MSGRDGDGRVAFACGSSVRAGEVAVLHRVSASLGEEGRPESSEGEPVQVPEQDWS